MTAETGQQKVGVPRSIPALSQAAREAHRGLVEVIRDKGPTACQTKDPELWFLDGAGSSDAAVAMCNSCPASSACLDYAMAADERFGVWGAKTSIERTAIRKAST